MKIALLADIHSNYAALEACIDYIEKNDYYGIVFLGDYVSDCPYPGRTLDAIKAVSKKYPVWMVRGNREEYMVDYHKSHTGDWNYSSGTGSLLYTYENIGPSDIELFEKLPVSMEVKIPGCPAFWFCHGSLDDTREFLYPESEISRETLKGLSADYLFCAHSHIPFKYEYKGKVLINCGSVGSPVNGQTAAQFAQIECRKDRWESRTVSVVYDIEPLITAFTRSGLAEKAPVWSKAVMRLLQTGENYPLMCLNRALDIARDDGFREETSGLPEKYWERAARELNV